MHPYRNFLKISLLVLVTHFVGESAFAIPEELLMPGRYNCNGLTKTLTKEGDQLRLSGFDVMNLSISTHSDSVLSPRGETYEVALSTTYVSPIPTVDGINYIYDLIQEVMASCAGGSHGFYQHTKLKPTAKDTFFFEEIQWRADSSPRVIDQNNPGQSIADSFSVSLTGNKVIVQCKRIPAI